MQDPTYSFVLDLNKKKIVSPQVYCELLFSLCTFISSSLQLLCYLAVNSRQRTCIARLHLERESQRERERTVDVRRE